jgi:hypothetical protein
MRQIDARDLRLAHAFVGAATAYWLTIFPRVRHELASWRARAAHIPDADLRKHALDALAAKRGNVEGAATFAILAPRTHRPGVVRLLVAYQVMHDYLDSVTEQAPRNALGSARRMHRALEAAFKPGCPHPDYFHDSEPGDGGYLSGLVDACRERMTNLGMPTTTRRRAIQLASLSGEAQSRLHAGQDVDVVSSWAADHSETHMLNGWELAAAACSTLAIYAIIASATDPRTDDISSVEAAFVPWGNALSTLLDRFVDVEADAAAGTRLSDPPTTDRLVALADEVARRCWTHPRGAQISVILAGMTAYYASSLDRTRADTAARIVGPFGFAGHASLAVFRVHRRLGRWASGGA